MNTKRKTWGWIILGFALLVLLVTGAGAYFLSQPRITARLVQHSVKKAQNEIEAVMATATDFTEYEKHNVGIYAFINDSLVFWNNNAVGPKLIKRKVKANCDTICNLLTGDYYVKSFEKGPFQCYAFKILNTTYKLENKYFRNRFVANKLAVNNKIVFGEKEGYEIVSKEGKLLAKAKIEQRKGIDPLYRKGLIIFECILALIGLALLLTKRSEKSIKKYGVEKGLALIILLAIGLTYLYNAIQTKRENQEMVKMAQSLLEKRDIQFETSYSQFEKQLKADTNLRDMVFDQSNVLNDVILGYCKELLFDENMKEYITTVTVCEPNEEITIQPEGYVAECETYFNEKISNEKQTRVASELYVMDYYTLDPSYLAKIKINSRDTLQQRTLYLEFYKPIAPEGFGFPQLLKEDNSQKPYDYSVANYRDNILTYKYGRYIYPNFLNSMKVRDKEISTEGGYKHYAINKDSNSALLISKPKKEKSAIIAPFALFFLGLLLPFLFILWLIRPNKHNKWKDRSFSQRLRTLVLLTLGISFLAIGPVTVLYMRSVYNQKTAAAQYETTRTVGQEMTNDLDLATLVDKGTRNTWNEILQHYAATFFTDLSLYDLTGKLIATTRQEVYELTLQAPIINAEAFQNMARNKNLYYTHKEYLGKGQYESAYIPLTDDHGNTLAYLNTPYFTSAIDLHNEIKNFILTYINIILILLGVALFFILRITRRLTQPLALIQNKMGDIKIDQRNEPIEWKGDDEIGALVKQYNQLIVELEKSAAELKRTTAESAWRGVARQVAHEIKNSLTPMRLSVQLLQHNIENGKATPEQIQRTTNTLIEQIDALSDIASSFSTYAKLPENHPAPLDLAELVGNVVNLYDNAENIKFNYVYDKSTDHTFNGDKTNLNSAVSNLVKNSVQAIGSKPDGQINVSLKSTANAFIISVKDNGKGIKEEDKSQIFLPNFTTKTGGSGVGLSLTYNIVQAAGGTISFKSQEGEGAEFIIELPKKQDQPNI
ncbi:MAG: HAMP domain-containing histidine kinase [Bacteroidales bacterium]|nr:HAMP domain-containing histidine kinase [Bacteroidales bacterium]